MSLVFTADQEALTDAVRRLVATHSPIAKVREVMDSDAAYDAGVWQRLVELGLPALTVPEEHGGAGATYADVSAAYRPLGAGLVPSPLLGSAVLAAGVLARLDDEAAQQEWLPRVAAGEAVLAAAVAEPRVRRWLPDRPATTATGGRLTGTKTGVLAGADADAYVVLAGGDGGVPAFHLVTAGAEGLTVTPEKPVDRTRATATLTFADTPATPLAGDALAALAGALEVADLVVVSEQVGAMEHVLAVTTEYATNRYSFGQPIGAYQGVKHKIADMFTSLALVDASLRLAVEEGDAGAPTFGAAAAAARSLANPAYVTATRVSMLLHGGIGFTWEHDAHLYHKRAMVDDVLLGTTEEHLDRLAALTLGG